MGKRPRRDHAGYCRGGVGTASALLGVLRALGTRGLKSVPASSSLENGDVIGIDFALVDVDERDSDTALGHDGVRLAEQRVADECDRRPSAATARAARRPAPPPRRSPIRRAPRVFIETRANPQVGQDP